MSGALLMHDSQIYRRLCPGRPLPRPRCATLRKLIDPRAAQSDERILDSGSLVLFFPAPQTVTGEDVLELHVHGGPAIVKAVLEAIPSCEQNFNQTPFLPQSHIRYAEPGEFTKRAFYNGRLDLTQAEALGDTLAAETEQQRRLAVNGVGGILAGRYEEWRTMLLYARGELEALIDFSEDQHFDESPHELVSSITRQVLALKRQVELHVQNASKGELLRNGISVALLGAPNAGKSSLLNRIVGREAAIVSQEEGTTRDIVDVSVDIGGWLVRLGDMAGLRNKLRWDQAVGPPTAIGAIEKEGMKRARARALESDVVVVVVSLERGGAPPSCGVRPYLESEVIDAVKECEQAGKTVVVALNKIDKLPVGDMQSRNSILSELEANFPHVQSDHIFTISCRPSPAIPTPLHQNTDTNTSSDPDPDPDPDNIQSFLTGLTNVFSTLATPSGDALLNPSSSYWSHSLSVTHRQRIYLSQALIHLDNYLLQTSSASPLGGSTHHIDAHHDDLIGDIDIVAAAEHLRFAAECLAKITGKGESGDVEDVLGVVFEK
jgi:tRNA modification GTPase